MLNPRPIQVSRPLIAATSDNIVTTIQRTWPNKTRPKMAPWAKACSAFETLQFQANLRCLYTLHKHHSDCKGIRDDVNSVLAASPWKGHACSEPDPWVSAWELPGKRPNNYTVDVTVAVTVRYTEASERAKKGGRTRRRAQRWQNLFVSLDLSLVTQAGSPLSPLPQKLLMSSSPLHEVPLSLPPAIFSLRHIRFFV